MNGSWICQAGGSSLQCKHDRLNMYAYSCFLFKTSTDTTVKGRLDKSLGNEKQRAYRAEKASRRNEGAGRGGKKPWLSLAPRRLIIKTWPQCKLGVSGLGQEH